MPNLLKRLPSLLFLTVGFSLVTLVLVAVAQQARPVQAAALDEQTDNESCLLCHKQPALQKTLPNGDLFPLFVDPQGFEASVHGQAGIRCVDCHTDITGFPHPEFRVESRREATLALYTACVTCHQSQYNQTQDSVHFQALASGNLNAAVCTDCHDPHNQGRITDPQTGQPYPEQRVADAEICGRCHGAIYDAFVVSVHGKALYQNNPDVPTCTTCHGVHDVRGPQEAAFRLRSPTEMCGRCHTDPQMMGKYGLSTNVLNSYVADFHGTTAILFEKVSPDQPFNKPLCTDCHGVHKILATDDPEHGLKIRENILTTCQRCHPTATLNFSDSWLSHYEPSPERYPIVYYVNLFYKIFIPLVLGSMSLFVLSDIYRRLIHRRKGTVQA